MFKGLWAVIRYEISVIIFNIRFHNYFVYQIEWVRQNWKHLNIIVRLATKGVKRDKINIIVDRYFGYKLYIQKKESKEAYKELMNFIGEWAQENDISQVEAREFIARSFHLDI